MGLDTTHDCWHGPYSSFMRWREALHLAISGADDGGLEEAWSQGRYLDQSVPINVLMNHSDCDGFIHPSDCVGIADALDALIEKLPIGHRLETRQFVIGLRMAAQEGRPVEFH